MALEIEYADVATDTFTERPEADPVDMINGDGNADALLTPLASSTSPLAEESQSISQEGGIGQEEDHEEMTLSEAEQFHQECVAEEHHKIEVAAAKEEHFSLAVKRSELENELKDIKADEKAALRNLRNLIKRGPNYPQPKSKIDEAVAAAGEPSAIVVDDPSADDTWKQVATSEIIDGIKGLGGKKAEAIISLAPTLGDLEELRAKASLVHKPFGSVLPRGIGGGMADEIEDRIEKWWCEYRRREKEIGSRADAESIAVEPIAEEV